MNGGGGCTGNEIHKRYIVVIVLFFIYYFFRGKPQVWGSVEVVMNTEEGEAVVVVYWCHVYVTFFNSFSLK